MADELKVGERVKYKHTEPSDTVDKNELVGEVRGLLTEQEVIVRFDDGNVENHLESDLERIV